MCIHILVPIYKSSLNKIKHKNHMKLRIKRAKSIEVQSSRNVAYVLRQCLQKLTKVIKKQSLFYMEFMRLFL